MKDALRLDIGTLEAAFAAGTLDPGDLLDVVHTRSAARGKSPIWVELVPHSVLRELLARARERVARGEKLPLYGVPFAIKDNIDFGGLPTTAGCPAFARVASEHAVAVGRLLDAGAIPIGKTNLDQFATGLVGTRSPYGMCASAFDERYLSGGSSSGSALAVAHGLVSFALGTDTAGSGRVPAAFNNVVGVKPTRGLVSTRGVVPACRSLDCVSVFSATVADGHRVLDVLAAFDAADGYSRENTGKITTITRVGVPAELEFFGDEAYARAFARAVERVEGLGVRVVRCDLEPFLEAARLLYGGPWIAERYAAVGEFIDAHASDVHPVVRDIVLGGRSVSGVDAFRGQYRLMELCRAAERAFGEMDALLLPTAPTHPTVEAALADPFELNAKVGRYTNFVNLLDLAGLAVPAGFTEQGLPFGVTLLGPAFSDTALAELGDRLHRASAPTLGATGLSLADSAPFRRAPRADEVLLAVAGAHLSGEPLNHELVSRGARLVGTVRSAADYRLFALAGTTPPKPGLVRAPGHAGPGIELEVWALELAAFGSFVAKVPPPMTIGTVALEDGSSVKGFACEPSALAGAEDITSFGGWRAYLASRR